MFKYFYKVVFLIGVVFMMSGCMDMLKSKGGGDTTAKSGDNQKIFDIVKKELMAKVSTTSMTEMMIKNEIGKSCRKTAGKIISNPLALEGVVYGCKEYVFSEMKKSGKLKIVAK